MRRSGSFQQGRGGRRGGVADDSIGNRKRPEDVQRHVPEDIGNRRTAEDSGGDVSDDIGNRLNGPAPWSRQFLRGKGSKGRRSPMFKEMESLYAMQGEGVPKLFRPGFRATSSGELAQMVNGELRPLGVVASTGERLGGTTHREERPQPGGYEAEGGGQPEEVLGEAGEGRRKRRRRRKRRGEGGGVAAVEGAPMQQAAPQAPQTGFEDEDEGFRYQLKSDPEDKRKAAQQATEQILKHAGRQATVAAQVIQEAHGPRVVVEIKETGGDGSLFARGTPALSALTFLVNKIINRYPDDRIRLSIVEAGTWVPAPAAAAPAPAATPAAPALAEPDAELEARAQPEPEELEEPVSDEEEGEEEASDEEEADEELDEEAEGEEAEGEEEEEEEEDVEEDVEEDEAAAEEAPAAATAKRAPARRKAPAAKAATTRAASTSARKSPARKKTTGRRPGARSKA